MKLCLYGKQPNNPGWVFCYVRITNGVVAFSATSWWQKWKVIPLYVVPTTDRTKFPTFIWTTSKGLKSSFG